MTYRPPSSAAAAAAELPELTQQLHYFFHQMDERRYDAMLALFTDDARWLRQGQWLLGKAAIEAALRARPADQDTRHVMSNAHIAALDGDHAVLEAYMTAYRYAVAADGVLPSCAGPLRLNLTTTVFCRDASGDWRIAEQRLVPAVALTNSVV
ncbi:nuclear transport factor 2 family protein [Variovorax sp. RHLX14]|uniref:nuclear transport factor 2 family protein n=1 Tax=Variovorax sp. RHLX14 TaxID=1259731 RepID=UPI003F450012